MAEDLDVLINFAEAHNVGHVVEALRYAEGLRAAAPRAHVGLVCNAASPIELAARSDAVDEVFTVPMYGPEDEVRAALAAIPRDWDHVLDNLRRTQPAHAEAVPGFAAYYAASDEHFRARLGRAMAGVPVGPTPGYVPDQHVRVRLTASERAAAVDELGGASPRIALLPAGSSARSLYPSVGGWRDVIDALLTHWPDARLVLVGKLAEDGRTASAFTRGEVDELLAASPGAVDAFDRPLNEQLALVEACDAFVSTHSGFGWAALAAETPWLTLSGGQWPEVFFNHVPFVSVLPDADRFGRYSLYEPPPVLADDEGEGPRVPHASRARIRADLGRIVDGAERLIEDRLGYEHAMREHFDALVDHLGGHRDALMSIDRVHERYVG